MPVFCDYVILQVGPPDLFEIPSLVCTNACCALVHLSTKDPMNERVSLVAPKLFSPFVDVAAS